MSLRWPWSGAQPKPPSQRLGRTAFDLLSLTVLAVLAVQAGHLPAWFTIVFVVLLALRWGQRRYRGGRVPWWVRLPLTLALPAALLAQYGSLLGQEPGSALVSGMLVLKLLETERPRDARAAVIFACFALMSALLFGQSLMTTLSVALGLVPALATLNMLEPARPAWNWRGPLLPVLRMLALALPLTLVGFLFIPRLSAPLWGAPAIGPARTGVSDSMTPADFTRLLLDNSPAFRVGFDGTRPPRPERYFRGPVLWHFDGRTWTTAHNASPRLPAVLRPPAEPLDVRGGIYHYQVTLEPTQRHWLFALDTPIAAPADAHFTPARTLLNDKRVRSVLNYRVRSSTRHVLEPELPDATRQRALQLPAGFDPRARALARRWRTQYAGQPQAIVNAALRLFHDGGFSYTLSPAPLGRNSVDDFLFSTREGFCEHYASAFTFLMRAAGVPARVVTGYQGGYWNDIGNYLLVRQSDAHAWSEVWIAGRGWVREDPTAAVRPERVDLGASAADAGSRQWYQAAWLLNLRNRWDVVNRWWNQAVNGFDALRQRGLLRTFGVDDADPTRLGLAFAIGLVSLMGLGLAVALWRRPERDPLRRAMRRLQRRLARLGIVRGIAEGPRDYLLRAASELPHERQRLQRLLELYLRLRYGPRQAETESARSFASLVREFRPRRAVQ